MVPVDIFDQSFAVCLKSGVYVGSSPENLPQKEIRLSAEIEMVGEKRLELLHLAILDPKSSASAIPPLARLETACRC
jgi:hypothetical protein